jgi:putative ABC transport system ATP-binding protein
MQRFKLLQEVNMGDYVQFVNVYKRYKMGDVLIAAADGISFSVGKGEFAVIVGPSGAGKTTVLNILGGMDLCDGGEVIVDEDSISNLSERQLAAFRRHDIGFVFQFYNLIQNLTALENVQLATQISPDPMDAAEVLEGVGLSDRLDNFPAQLSGGEQQRVAIARALAKRPKLLLCDEPTGALDFKTGITILKLLQDMCRIHGKTVIVVTHNQAITPMADRIIRLRSGRVSEIKINSSPSPVDSIEW